MTSIEEMAFSSCYNLTEIKVDPNNLIYDSRNNCNAIIETISNKLISGCGTTVIPEGITSIGEDAFRECSNLMSITIPQSVSEICSQAFLKCENLETVFILGKATIGINAFKDCNNLTSITLPDNVTNIGNYAFKNCSSLTSITIPNGVTSIGYEVFYDCGSLTSITSKAVIPPSIKNSDTFYGVNKSIPVYVPAGSVDAYKAAEGWSEFSNIVSMAVSITHIALSQSSVTLIEGKTITLTATVTPDDATDSSVTWSSSAPSVATVDNTGKVTAIAPGSVTMTATANDGSGVSASCEVTVTPASYVITFLIDGEQFYTQTLTRGSTITLPEAPTKEGYTFSGWSEIPETMPANDVTIEGTFTQLPSVFLTINQADNGYVKQQLTAGAVCTFTIEAAEGWKIHTVTFNGEDVTSQLEEGSIYTTPEMLEDAVLNIAYEQEVPEGVENAHARAIKVRGLDNTIHISGSDKNDGLYTVKEVNEFTCTVNEKTRDEIDVFVTKVEYPADVKVGAIELMKHDLCRREKVGIASERISRHEVSYHAVDATNTVQGYPQHLMGFLKQYMKARFGQGVSV